MAGEGSMMVGKEVMRDLGWAGLELQPLASLKPALSLMIITSQSSSPLDGTLKRQSSKFVVQKEKPNWLHRPVSTCSAPAKGEEPKFLEGGISCWGSTVVPVRPRVGSGVCSVGLGSMWLCIRWSAAVGKSWLCHQG